LEEFAGIILPLSVTETEKQSLCSARRHLIRDHWAVKNELGKAGLRKKLIPCNRNARISTKYSLFFDASQSVGRQQSNRVMIVLRCKLIALKCQIVVVGIPSRHFEIRIVGLKPQFISPECHGLYLRSRHCPLFGAKNLKPSDSDRRRFAVIQSR
jgi:hypothetical protein